MKNRQSVRPGSGCVSAFLASILGKSSRELPKSSRTSYDRVSYTVFFLVSLPRNRHQPSRLSVHDRHSAEKQSDPPSNSQECALLIIRRHLVRGRRYIYLIIRPAIDPAPEFGRYADLQPSICTHRTRRIPTRPRTRADIQFLGRWFRRNGSHE